ncbi:hypothetical protein Smp_179350 [Schistosoma mansoni]|uniref:hypothetical protein n=1 Tax=Schistosoma mansoni TaxID=6183 RepID=UPI00022DBF38|nr:hypothetical protein Smp_179350 [Schistosoma mansoni]|eukprot:XP_018653153.1 hypothetical protein Smp_179350 [Schistosoma mansoni]
MFIFENYFLGNNSPIEILNSLDKTSHNAGDFSTVSNPDQSSMSNSNNNNNPLTSSICSCSPLWNTGTNNNSNTFPISSSSRLIDDVNVSSSSSSSSLMIGRDIIRNMSETNYFLDDNIQVAKVAAGLIISKKPPYYHHHQQQHCSGSGYPTRISGLTPVSTIFTGASNTTSTSTACGAVKTGNCKQSLPSTVPSFRFSSTSSTRHHRHTHHHRFIFDGPNSSGNQSSSGCSTTAVLPSVPIPSIGTNSDINHNFMHSSLSSSSEYNRTQLHPESLLSKQRQYSQQYHNSLLNFISSCQTYNSLNTSTSDLNCSTTTTSSSVESTLDQVDNNKNISDEDYWDLRDNSNCQHKLIIQSSKMDSTIVGVADTSKESDNLCVMTGAIPSDSVELHTCKESSPYPCELNQFTNTPFIYPHFYLSSIEPSQCIYRHRLQQYRVCNCISLLRRSFSANSNIQFIDLSNNDLQIFNFRPSLTLRTMRSLDSCIVPRSKSINDNSSIEKTIGATDHDSKLYRTLQSYSTNPHISVQSPLCKSFCGGRFQKIHRLFHRKQHSQSHDNLECSKTSVDRSKLLNDIDFDTQLWDEVKSKHILCTNIPFWNCTGNDADTDETHENRFDRILDLSYRIFICPRHGVQSLHWNFSSDDGQQHISRLNTSRRDSVFQSKKLLKSTPVNQKHSNVSTLLPHLLNSIALPRPLSLVRLTTEKSKYHCRKSFEHYIKNKESKVTNLNFDKDSNDDYNHELLEGRKLLSLNKDTSESSNNSQQYESLISSSSLSRNMKERNNNNNDIGSLSNYCDVEFLNELRLHLLRMNSHHNVISNNNNMPGQIESSQQRKNVNDIVGENVTCIHDMQHGSNDDSDMLQSSLYSDKQTQSLSSSASSSGGLTTTKSSDITWSKALYGNSTIDSNINESNYSINQLSCNSSTSNSNNRQSYLSKLFDRSFSSNAKSLSPSIISPTIRANTLPTTRILRQQSIDHKNTWNNINNHLICVNSSKVDTTNQDIIANGNSINQKVNNRLYFLHHSDHRNSAMQDNHHHFKINTTISSDKANNVLTRKFSHQSEIDHFSRIMTTNISSSNNNNKNNVNRRSRKSDEQLNDKSTLSSCNVEQQIPVEYPVYNNLIELRENVRPLSNDGVGSMLTYDLKSIPSLLSSVITSISGSLPSESLLSSQSLHVTINEDNGYQHHHLNQSTTANYVNLPMFWSNHHSTTTPTPSSMFSRSSTSCQRQHSTDVTTTATTTIEPRLYANIMPSNTTSKYQSVRNKQQSKTDFSLLSKNHIRHSGSGIPPSVADCTGNSSSSSNSSLTGESQMPSGVVIDHNSKIMDISEKSHSLDPTSVINLIPTTTATIPQYCPVAVVARAQEAANLPTNSDYSNLPDEVRDPSRNYAMVDLRPSPASSTIPPAELTLNIIQHHNDNRTATLTSDTIESYETIGASNNNHSYNNSKLNKLKTKNSIDTDSYGGRGDDDNLLTGSISSSRRRHSHSLSSVTTTDHPSILLNYIHVIAASNGRFTSLTTTTDGTVQLSGPCSVGDSNHNHNNKSLICDFGNSPNSSNSSSSALGGVTSSSSSSHSTGSSLVPVSSTSFGDTFSCRSMTSSGISSVEGGGGVAVSDMIELSSCSPSDENCVNYTQIDFARTMALGELSGDIMAQENQMLHKLPSTATGIRIANRWSSSSSNKIDRTTSVKKTLCRSIRLIGRGTRKKVG